MSTSVAKSQMKRGTDRLAEDHGKVKSRQVDVQVQVIRFLVFLLLGAM